MNGANLTDFWDGFTLEFTPADRPKHGLSSQFLISTGK